MRRNSNFTSMTKQLLSLFACLMLFGSAFSQTTGWGRFSSPVHLDTVPSVSSMDTIANCFSPNNDGMNDVFQIAGAGLTDFKLSIYNRWGTIVYDFISPDDAWDGYTTTGEPCSNGTYFYVLKANGVDGKTYSQNGTIQLFR